MGDDKSFCIEFVDGLNINSRRGVAWLIVEPENKEINAKKIFDSLADKLKNDVFNRFDYWVSGQKFDKYYHGWSEPGYTDCFVFKYKKAGQHQRLYGFLCNPFPDNSRFQLCVLISHTTKNEHEADKSEKNKVVELKKEEAIMNALKDIKENCLEGENENKLD